MFSRALSIVLCLLSLLPSPAHAQAAPPPPVPPPAAPTLAQALAQAEVPHDIVYLAVAAEKTMLPKDTDPAPLPPGASLAQVADAYGRLIQAWETAAAIAPPTMTILNTDPGTPNPYEGLPISDALKLLLGGLDDTQWQALTGDQGLGYDTLTTDSQRDLFKALFPHGTLTVQPQNDYDPQQGTTLTADDLQSARLRLRQQMTMMLQVTGQPNSHSGTGVTPDDGKTYYQAGFQSDTDQGDTVYGIQVRATVPNTLKPSDLDPTAPALQVSVPLAGVRTVGDLVIQIGRTTHIELYADRRYEKRTVTFIGPASAHAGDLLRALALCVCGTYRKVGPAFVLTDDVMGLGTRQTILSRFAQAADMARAGAEADAGDKMVMRGGIYGLPAAGPGLGVSDAEQAQARKDDPSWDPRISSDTQVPFLMLSPQQQALARREAKQMQAQQQTNPGWQNSVTLDGTVMLQPQPTLELLSAAVPGPVTLDSSVNTGQLFQPSNTLRQKINQEGWARWQERQKQQEADAAKDPKAPMPVQPAPPPTPSLATLFASLPRRAVLAQPRTAKDVDTLIAAMRKLGLNQLWLDVFSEGKSHLDGHPDILTEALAKAKGTGITVIPMLNLLTWATDAPEGAADRTVLGETSAQATDYQTRYQGVVNQDQTPEDVAKTPPTTSLSVCPTAPEVLETLTALVQRLAATPGVAALALQGTTILGYDYAPDQSSGGSDDLGYTLSLRLACLRQTHVDPVDLDMGLPEPMGRRDEVPDFTSGDWQTMQTINQQWNALRAEADVALMRRLLSAAQQNAGRRVPFLVKQRGQSWNADWWGLWDDPRAPLPTLTQEGIQTSFQSGDALARFAHTQCRVDVYTVSGWAAQSPEVLASQLQQMKPGWDGIVIDGSGVVGGDPLAALTQSVASSKTAGPAKP